MLVDVAGGGGGEAVGAQESQEDELVELVEAAQVWAALRARSGPVRQPAAPQLKMESRQIIVSASDEVMHALLCTCN